MKLSFIYLSFFLVLFFNIPVTYAQVSPCEDPDNPIRCAECDQCGYCRGQPTPSDEWIATWDKCRDCLYGESDASPQAHETLLVVEPTNPPDPTPPLSDEEKKEFARPIKPAAGKYYTQLGCINTNLSTFQDPGAAGGLLNFLLTKLLFPIAGVLGFLAILYGAFLLITAQGNPGQVQVGKNYVVGAIVGLIFVFTSILLVSLIGKDILRIPGLRGGKPVTIRGYGQRAIVNGVERWPTIGIYLDTVTPETKLGQLTNFRGSGSNLVTQKFYLPAELKTEDLEFFKRIRLKLDNDYCYTRTNKETGACCNLNKQNPTHPDYDPLCANTEEAKAKYDGDVNFFLYDFSIDEYECKTADYPNGPYNLTTGRAGMFWGSAILQCGDQ